MKFCTKCGAANYDQNVKCTQCGEDLPTQGVRVNDNIHIDGKSNSSVTGFVLGICSLIAWFFPLIGYPVTICGIVFSSRGLKDDKKTMAIIGLVLSIIGLIATVINSILGVLANTNTTTN